jgi:hypothetical protein
MDQKLSILQKTLLGFLYLSLLVIVILSINATKNIGKDGFDGCMKNECAKGEDHCSKYRTISNCCVGAGGVVGVSEENYICQFS